MSLYRRKAVKNRSIKVNNNIIMLTIATVLILSIVMIGRIHFVKADESVQYDKTFQAIEIEPGDTLSAIAHEYARSDADCQDYMEEVIEINGLKDGQIHAGCYLMIPVYTVVSSK